MHLSTFSYTFNTKGKRLADLIALLPDHHPLKKDRIIFKPAIKAKRQPELCNSNCPNLLQY
jgi:hypothetical protein